VRALSLFFFSALQFRALFWILGSVSCSASVRFCSLAERGFRGISALRFWVRIEVELEEEGMGGRSCSIDFAQARWVCARFGGAIRGGKRDPEVSHVWGRDSGTGKYLLQVKLWLV